MTEYKELAREWAVCNPDSGNGWLHKYWLECSTLKIFDFEGDAILAECAVKDRIWGIGLSIKDERRFDLKEWRGQNLLGYVLMEVRREIHTI